MLGQRAMPKIKNALLRNCKPTGYGLDI